jgi:hypothetical protein
MCLVVPTKNILQKFQYHNSPISKVIGPCQPKAFLMGLKGNGRDESAFHMVKDKLKILTPSRLFSLLSPDATTSQFTLPKKQKFTVTGCAATLRHPHCLEPAPAALPHCAPCSGHDERHCRFFKPLTRGVVGASRALVLCSGSIEVRHHTTCYFEPRAQEAKSDFELRCVLSTTTKISVYQHDRATSRRYDLVHRRRLMLNASLLPVTSIPLILDFCSVLWEVA